MFRRQTDDDWAAQVPDRPYRTPYEDYGWETGESVLPEFRKPDEYLTPEERREVQRAMRRVERRGLPHFQPGFDRNREYRDLMPGSRGNYYQISPWLIPGRFSGVGPRTWIRVDDRIQDLIYERLMRHGWIDATHIRVSVRNGEVTLDGSVPDRRMRRLAEDVAYSVHGVTDVWDDLIIESGLE